MGLSLGDLLPNLKTTAVMQTKVCELDLQSFKGSYLVMFFYTMDNTEYDALEARGFMDYLNQFESLGVNVVGVSRDSIDSHLRFSKKFNLSYPLISDPKEILLEQIGALKKVSLLFWETHLPLRNTYIFDFNGNLIRMFERVSSKKHASEVFDYLSKRIQPNDLSNLH